MTKSKTLHEESREVIVKDRLYTEQEVGRISKLRQERWNLYAAMSMVTMNSSNQVVASEYARCNQRLKRINHELLEITGNEIYRC
tara:strand:- start:173 stop:427 length:255 start_codon:yes stop_codon:yes gene_type:complete